MINMTIVVTCCYTVADIQELAGSSINRLVLSLISDSSGHVLVSVCHINDRLVHVCDANGFVCVAAYLLRVHEL